MQRSMHKCMQNGYYVHACACVRLSFHWDVFCPAYSAKEFDTVRCMLTVTRRRHSGWRPQQRGQERQAAQRGRAQHRQHRQLAGRLWAMQRACRQPVAQAGRLPRQELNCKPATSQMCLAGRRVGSQLCAPCSGTSYSRNHQQTHKHMRTELQQRVSCDASVAPPLPVGTVPAAPRNRHPRRCQPVAHPPSCRALQLRAAAHHPQVVFAEVGLRAPTIPPTGSPAQRQIHRVRCALHFLAVAAAATASARLPDAEAAIGEEGEARRAAGALQGGPLGGCAAPCGPVSTARPLGAGCATNPTVWRRPWTES